MAAGQLVLNNALCFILNKYGKIQLSSLKTAVSDFYSLDTIAEAKWRILDDSKDLPVPGGFPHIPRRRDCQARTQREIDDIFTVVQLLDENGLIDKLPRYVSDNPENMPSVRLFEGDMLLLLSRLEKMETKVGEYGSALSAIKLLCTTMCSNMSKVLPTKPVTVPGPGVVNNTGSQSGVNMGIAPPMTSWNPNSCASSQRQVQSQVTQQPPGGQMMSSTASWADRSATSSTPAGNLLVSNRYSALVSTTDDEHYNSDDQFQVVRSRRSARRNKRALDTIDNQVSERTNNAQRSQPARGKTRMFGKSSMSADSNISAAAKIYKKAVFCVDNVKDSCTQEEIQNYITNLGVKLLSCYKVKPRRSRSELQSNSPSKLTKKAAFRICIAAEDQDALLDPQNWPDSVTIADWYFKPADKDKRQRLEIESVSNVGDQALQSVGQNETMDSEENTLTPTDHSQPHDNVNDITL